MTDEILIWGAGAIGGTIGAYWARAGVPVRMVDIVPEHAAACSGPGLRIEGPVEEFTQAVPCVTPDELAGHLEPHRAGRQGAGDRGGHDRAACRTWRPTASSSRRRTA